jgi:phospholipase/carboxylesterase
MPVLPDTTPPLTAVRPNTVRARHAAVTMAEPSYVHTLIADADRTTTPLVLLHGLGGTELDLVPLAAQMAPGSPVLAIRGAVAVEGGHAFFQRSGERTIDEAAIREQAAPLADFIVDTCARHGFAKPPIAIGFSCRWRSESA